MFRNSSRFNLSCVYHYSWPLRDLNPSKHVTSDPTTQLLRSKLSPPKMHLFYQNLEDLDTFNLDLLYQNESNSLGSYLEEFDMKFELQRQRC